ncbi:xylose and arabinose reductase [Schizosaccharomyces pombe]|uniref:Uncharacterized oxidoreductase C28F2.05 n=1 Tax=Schizosaccharomyces pombe (strain 972 / ATCC 24843) TaxID=284812 RepID=YHH5_SCHPO|nr:putative xylose and arabinose reductase [Schizosaccharomyces pombe]Q9USV2.1 RecName: Full=Uncharacterized oxidoreductase C28F2.05 [Schizosaccharomyces pombe 972h-]CAB57934.1 xylose and arabinose reductase (predicted) [Schizosaccharomyces pombe]|eukprot:NP_595666.1 putative xylose and arabinose reductase [Schizosaccharomyces pombe]
MKPFSPSQTNFEKEQLCFGVYQLKDCYQQVIEALSLGIRVIDSAITYRNEKECEQAIQDFCHQNVNIKREDITLITKIPDSLQGFERTWKAVEQSLRRTGRPKLDVVLIHSPKWPVRRIESWRALLQHQKEGRINKIGVSNYNIHHLEEIISLGLPLPAINQVEFSAFNNRPTFLSYCFNHGILVQAFSPLTRGYRLSDIRLLDLSLKYNKTPANILLRYCLQKGVSPIFKASSFVHIHENVKAEQFMLDPSDMDVMDTWDEEFVSKPTWNPIILP